MAKASKFVYRGSERTVESVVRKSKQAGGLYDSFLVSDATMFKPKEGENCVRIMPPTWEDLDKYGDGWELGVYLHYDVGPDNGAYLCLDKMKGESCPVCEARRQADEDEADKLKPSFRSICWVIDRDNEKAGPLIWSLPITLFREINQRSVDKKTNTPILIDDPEEGYDLVFNRAGEKVKTKYTAVEVSRDPTPLHDDERLQQRWLDYITENPLPAMLNFFDAEHIEKVLFGKSGKKDAEEVEDAPLPRRSSRRAVVEEEEAEDVSPSRRSRREPEEVEEDAPPPRRGRAAAVEEEEDAPSPRRGRAAAVEEVEDEPAPRSTRRRALLAEPDDDVPFEEAPRAGRRGAVEQEEVVGRAKRSLERLKPAGKR